MARSRLLVAALLIGCGPRGVATTGTTAPTTTRSDGAERVCVEQAGEVTDAVTRLQDAPLWEEVEKLVQLHGLARLAPDGAAACTAAAQAAIVLVARRWAEEGVASGGPRTFDLAQRAWRALVADFPDATPPLRHLYGRLEWTRAQRIVSELGEPTLAADRYLAAHEHHTAALRAGLLTPEEARLSAIEQVEALRRALDYQDVRWDWARWVCAPDPRSGECAAAPQPPVPGAMSAADSQMLAAYSVYLAEPATRGLAEARTIALDRAELLLRQGRLAEAEPDLRGAVGDGEVGARAGLLWVRSLQARWQAPGAPAGERAAARRGLIAATTELRAGKAWQATAPSSGELRTAAPWLRAVALRQDAFEARLTRDFTRCAREFELLTEETGREGAAELRFEAALCAEQGGAYVKAIDGYKRWLAEYAGHRLAPDVEVHLGKTHERVLNVEAARDAYIRFLALAPDDLRAPEVRRWSIGLALVTGTLEDAQVDQLARTGERNLAATIRFRTEVRPGSPLARIQGYIQRFGRDGGPARLAIAHVRAAVALMRSSCPAHALGGLCVEVTREKTLGRVVARDQRQLGQARVHLDAAAALLATDLSARAADEGPPLAIEPGEVATARRVLSLLRGDLGAEAALSTRPPASLDPQRSREWFERRTNEVARMKVVYESVNPGAGREVALMDAAEATASDRFAAVLEARKAQVYEADVGLLDEVAAAVAANSAPGSEGATLAAAMRTQADERRVQVFAAYHRCIDLVAAWGHDPDSQAETCRAGLGRLVQRYEGRLEYVPAV